MKNQVVPSSSIRGVVRMDFLTAEASVSVAGKPLACRELLRIDAGDRRFELRPPQTRSGVCVDLAPGLLHATLIGGDRSTLEVEWIVHGNGATAVEAWAICARNSSEVSIMDSFGRNFVPDLLARDPAMPPLLVPPGLYLLRAATSDGPLVLRIGQSTAHHAARAAG
jgi:hypothetical protein